MMSWGSHNFYGVEDGLRFSVDGFLHQGTVQVKYNEASDAFDVVTISKDGSIQNEVTDVYIDSLVMTIDGMVERTSDYKERVDREYGL